MEVQFKTPNLEEWFVESEAKQKKLPFGTDILNKYKKVINILLTIDNFNQLKLYKGLSLEPMTKEKKRNGQYAVRLNDQYRLHFSLNKASGRTFIWVEEITKHYEKIKS